MKIAIDAMGGDFAPKSTIEGAIQAANEYGYEIILVGEEFFLKKELSKYKAVPDKISIKHASEIIGMDEAPAVTIRKKKDSSINVAVNLVRDKLADAMVTAGNTGAVVCSAALNLKTLEAIDRPGISVVLPTLLGQTLLIDVGANIDCKPEHLLQYAIMGSVYCRYVLSKKEVRVGLLSIGEEKSKGTELTKITHSLIDKSSLNFIGNVEGKDIFSGRADVIVCDGFTGNIILKVLESVAETVTGLFKQQLSSNLFTMLGGLLSMPAFRNLKRKVDYA
ncbi:MAG: phosphate acyltransferase PlsX, partial [Candidatus Omnitrophica bacterium]|nr:phosphate acyltransferase PlsX [Candidatus Omnitrophota bacterium]